MNFGEAIAYWYLRLNGFIPLAGFVLHHNSSEENYHRTSDADLIAVRFPHVVEKTGGQRDDWDNERFGKWGINITAKTIGVFVEVKSGGWTRNDLAERHWRIGEGIERLGMVPVDAVEKVSAMLKDHSRTEFENFTFAKLLVHSAASADPSPETLSWLTLLRR